MLSKGTLVLALLVATYNSVAHADNGVVLTRGDAGERERVAVIAAMEAALRAAGWKLPAKPLTKKESAAVLACSDSKEPWTCVPAAFQRVLVVRVDNQPNDTGVPVVAITGKMIAPEQQAIVVQQRYCEQCADDQLGEASTELAVLILREAAVRSGRTVAEITSEPDGARILLDGNPVAATPAKLNTYPGKHSVMIEKPGYVSQIREFSVENGKTATIAFKLAPSGLGAATSGEIQEEPPRSSSRWLPVTLVSGGAALAALGGYGFYLRASEGEKFGYSRASAVAFTGSALGVAAIGTGVYLWLRGSKASTRPVTQPSLAPNGAALEWGGTF